MDALHQDFDISNFFNVLGGGWFMASSGLNILFWYHWDILF